MNKFNCFISFCLIFFLSIQGFAGQWVYRPMTINAKKGDIVLSGEKGMIADVVNVISGYWEHAGMVIDDGMTIRHNTRDEELIEYDYNYIHLFGKKIKTLPKGMNAESLANGLPGIITEDINTAFNGEKARFHVVNGVVVKPRSVHERLYRPKLERAAEKMKQLDAYYRISAYSNMFQQDYTSVREKGKGGMCSSSIWFANYFAGNVMNYMVIPPSLTSEIAGIIYQSVINQAADEYGIFGKILFWIQDIIGTGTDEKIANQVVNAFGFDRPWDQSDSWRSQQLTALTVSPDSLLLAGFTNPNGMHGGVQTEKSSCYETVEPVTITNGYFYYIE